MTLFIGDSGQTNHTENLTIHRFAECFSGFNWLSSSEQSFNKQALKLLTVLSSWHKIFFTYIIKNYQSVKNLRHYGPHELCPMFIPLVYWNRGMLDHLQTSIRWLTECAWFIF